MQALCCMHSPGLSHSGSGSWVLHKGVDLVGPAFCAVLGLSSSGDQVLGACSHPQLEAHPIASPVPAARVSGCAMGMSSRVCIVSLLGS